MKIRTDFVTNSSSMSSAEIVIDNIVLLEILQRYKDMGVFGDSDPRFTIGYYESDFEDYSESAYEGDTKTPAFFLYEYLSCNGWQTVHECPSSLDEVLAVIISTMESYTGTFEDYDQDLYKLMKEELLQRKQEIKNRYLGVRWSYECRSSEIDEGHEGKWEFTYDPENGEKYSTKIRIDENEND